MAVIQCMFLGIGLLLPLTVFSSNVTQATGSIAMHIKLLDNTCAIDTVLGNVNLGLVALREIQNNGGLSKPVPFTVTLKDCGMAAKNVQVIARGTTAIGNDNSLALTGEAGVATAQGIGIYIRDNKNRIVSINQPDMPAVYKLTPGANSVLNFSAQYVVTSDLPKAGKADSDVNLEFIYE